METICLECTSGVWASWSGRQGRCPGGPICPGRPTRLRNRGRGWAAMEVLVEMAQELEKGFKFLLNILACYLNEFKWI
jgi:hypothetical protein